MPMQARRYLDQDRGIGAYARDYHPGMENHMEAKEAICSGGM
jgi:hypothetical protein